MVVKRNLLIFFLFLGTCVVLSACSYNGGRAPAYTLSTSNKSPSYKNQKSTISEAFYIVQPGDTLFSIAWRAGIDFKKLARLNKIDEPYTIFPRQKLQLRQITVRSQESNKSHDRVTQKRKDSKTRKTKPLAQGNQGEYVRTKGKQKTVLKEKKPVSKKAVAGKKDRAVSNKISSWYWPADGKIIGWFSSKENGNKGLDISGRVGEKIVAAASGKVVYAGNALRGYGNLIIIKHNDDYLSAYAHSRKILVSEKQYVKAGQVIAEMGSTDSTVVKLHFEVRYRGKSVNPLRYLPKRKRK